MDHFQRKQSINTLKPAAQEFSPPSKHSEERLRTSFNSTNPRDTLTVSQKRQYNRMKVLFKSAATQYFDREIKGILSEEVKKIKEKEKVKNMIDAFKSPGNKQNARVRHHQRVASISEQVKQKDLQKSVDALEKYIKKKEAIDQRVKTFIKEKREMFLNRSMSTQRTNRSAYEEPANLSTIHCDETSTYRRRNLVHTTDSTDENIQRRQKLLRFRRKQQQTQVSYFMTKMKDVQERLAKKQIQKHNLIQAKKKVPVKCFTNLRNSRYESKRQEAERVFEEKLKTIDSKIQTLHQKTQEMMFNKSVSNMEHSRLVNQRKRQFRQLSEEDISKKLTASKLSVSSVVLRRQRSQKILLLKRQYKLKKEYEYQKNSKLMRKLVDKINDLNFLDSKSKLPQSQVHNFNRLLHQIVDGTTKTQIIESPKFNVARKIFLEEEAQLKNRKLGKKVL